MGFNIFEIINIFIEKYTTEVVGGLTVAVILLAFNYILKFIKNIRTTKKHSGYIGNYYLYWYSSTGLDKIVSARLEVKTRFGKLIVTVESDSKVYKYSGTMHITERNLYLNYEGINHIEKINLIFHSPLHKSIKKLIGVLSAISPIDEPIAQYCLLSDSEVTENIISNRFKKLQSDQKGHLLKVPRDNEMFFDNLNQEVLSSVYGIE